MRDPHRTDLMKLLIGPMVVGLALALGLVMFGAIMVQRPPHDQIWIEIAKAGLQLGIVSIIGGGITLILKRFERRQEERRTLNEYRLKVLHDVTTSYNQIKAVRRTLRAFGFKTPRSLLTLDQVIEFRGQMKSLDEAQLALERLKREVRVRSDSFCKAQQIQCALVTAEEYIQDVLKDWETKGVDIIVGAAPNVPASMGKLQTFLDKAEKEKGFTQGVADPMELIERLIRSQTVGK